MIQRALIGSGLLLSLACSGSSFSSKAPQSTRSATTTALNSDDTVGSDPDGTGTEGGTTGGATGGTGGGTTAGSGTGGVNGVNVDGPSNLQIPVGGTTGLPSGANSCTSSNTAIAKVDPTTCAVTGVAPGKTEVNFTNAQGTQQSLPVIVTDNAAASTGIGISTDAATTAAIAAIPGVTSVQVGVNFEDMGPYGDKDFNDAVLCFVGNFKVAGASVVSIANQTVTGYITARSSCNHYIDITVIAPNGTRGTPIHVDDRFIPGAIPLTFALGSQLDVTMTSYTEPCTNDSGAHPDLAGPHDLTNAIYSQVLPNVCRTTGN